MIPRKRSELDWKEIQKTPTIVHWMMLRYWHARAPEERQLLERLPDPGPDVESLIRRNITSRELDFIEECYYDLRASEKMSVD